MKQGRHGNMFLLQSREPTYTNGNYRLNFYGRVTVPSVKNFQLVSPDDLLHTVCQFGKVQLLNWLLVMNIRLHHPASLLQLLLVVYPDPVIKRVQTRCITHE